MAFDNVFVKLHTTDPSQRVVLKSPPPRSETKLVSIQTPEVGKIELGQRVRRLYSTKVIARGELGVVSCIMQAGLLVTFQVDWDNGICADSYTLKDVGVERLIEFLLPCIVPPGDCTGAPPTPHFKKLEAREVIAKLVKENDELRRNAIRIPCDHEKEIARLKSFSDSQRMQIMALEDGRTEIEMAKDNIKYSLANANQKIGELTLENQKLRNRSR